MQTIQPGKYRHYKGNYYEVTGFATHSETLEKMVIYKALYQEDGNNVWVRPLAMFAEKVNVEGNWLYRFQKV